MTNKIIFNIKIKLQNHDKKHKNILKVSTLCKIEKHKKKTIIDRMFKEALRLQTMCVCDMMAEGLE